MNTLNLKFILLINVFLISLFGACRQSVIENQEKNKTKNSQVIEEEIISLVAEQKIVKNQIRLIDSLSLHKRHISIIPQMDDTAKSIYLVQVGEMNGQSFVTYFNFMVDGNKKEILNPSGKLEGQ